jgi:hypothetical protein
MPISIVKLKIVDQLPKTYSSTQQKTAHAVLQIPASRKHPNALAGKMNQVGDYTFHRLD